MKTLSASLRRQLERTVVSAREVAETGSRAALESLAVPDREPYAHMSQQQRALRNRLRAHGRQLGDRRHASTGRQAIDHLVHECAYEQWHSMLFARFLAENHLLIEPQTGVAVTLDECEELAQEEGLDRWALAARFAHRMLPQVFRPDHPALAVRLAREHRLALERLVEELPAETFGAVDALGWVYQFWQSRKKEQVNRSEVKIGADELPAVTQLFTEPYMVHFLLDNTLGAWWVARRLDASVMAGAADEAALRRAAALPGVPLDYLRFVRAEKQAEGPAWRPAAGAFAGWPQELRALRVIDPCCGSGHFLVAALAMLTPMRMALEGLDARAAVDAVLCDNLYGLELDARCVALAAFALALAAWRYPGTGGYRPLPEFHVACSGVAPNATREQWIVLAEQAAAAAGMPVERDLFNRKDSLLSEPLRHSMAALHELFSRAPELGSLIAPRVLQPDLFQADYETVRESFSAALAPERVAGEEQNERAVAAQGMARAAELLAGSYHLVATNVPYLARGKQDHTLRDFCDRYHPVAKNDLATVFLERCLALCTEGGTASLVLPQNWLFLKSYQKLREKLLKAETWHLFVRLGPKAFQTPMWDFNVQLLTLSRGNPAAQPAGLFGPSTAPGTMYGFDVSDSRTAPDKAARLPTAELTGIAQSQQLKNPLHVIASELLVQGELLADVADYGKGSTTGDGPRYLAYFWEYLAISTEQIKWLNSPDHSAWSGRTQVCKVPLTDDSLNAQRGCRLHGQRVYGRIGVSVNKMRQLAPLFYAGEVFDDNICPIVPKDPALRAAVWVYVQSVEYKENVRAVDQALKVTAATLTKVPFDRDRWSKVADEKYPNGLPLPYSDDPTQWIFHGHPCGSVVWDETDKWTTHGPLRTDRSVLQVAVARLLGYRWPAERDTEMELAEEQREWVRRCESLSSCADEDGIVCIPPVRGEPSAAERLLRLLVTAYGDEWHDGVLTKILADAGALSLDDWLRNRFFEQHCTLFHQRPVVWHVWDGRRRDGFHALVNYHKLSGGDVKGRQLLESLTYSYLGDWITRQQDGAQRGEAGAEDRLTAALELRRRLEAILHGEPPFDIFVRWKPIHQQPIGWEPDINDGVRLNMRPFMADDLSDGKKGAGILRAKPNLHWRKDRGKEPFRDQERFPWFWNAGEFTGDRVNDVHLSRVTKRHSRETLS